MYSVGLVSTSYRGGHSNFGIGCVAIFIRGRRNEIEGIVTTSLMHVLES